MTITIVNFDSHISFHVQHFSEDVKNSYTTFVEPSLYSSVIADCDKEKANTLAPLTSLLSSFSSASLSHTDTGIMPPGVLHVSKNFVVFERPPSYQNIFIIPKVVSDISNNEEPILYRLPIPWQLYIVQYSSTSDEYYTANVRMHFMSSSLVDVNQNIYMAPLTNLYTSGELCRPMYSSMDDIDRYPKNISGVINAAYDWIWNSGANVDLTASIVNSFNQLKDDPQNTILQNISPISLAKNSYSFNIDSYYCSGSLVNDIYSSWEKIPLDQVSLLRWPNNSINRQFIDDLRIAREEHYDSYIRDNNIYSPDCCDECSYYDEDNEEYINSDECECSCHNSNASESSSHSVDFYQYAGVWPVKDMKYIDSFQNFIKESYPFQNSLFQSNVGYTSMIDSIILST